MRTAPLLACCMHGGLGWRMTAAPLVSLLEFRTPAALKSNRSRGYNESLPANESATRPARGSGGYRVRGAAASMCSPGCRSARGFASGAGARGGSGKLPTLQQQIRQLMKLVHPDRWAASRHAEARSENERSFKLLQEYLEAAKVGELLLARRSYVG